MQQKLFSGSVVANDATLGERQIRVIANTGRGDRIKDVVVAKGCKLANYLQNPIVFADHDRTKCIGNFAPEIVGDQVVGIITFAPAGVSAKADEECGLYKSGVKRAVSIGFEAIKATPNKAGGITFEEWELLELSCVGVPCDPGALTVARTLQPSAHKADEAFKCGASRNLPLGSDEAWDGPAAAASIFEHAKLESDDPDLAFMRKGFLAYDSAAPKLKGSYKLPFAQIVDGRLTAMPAGIRASASRLPQSDIPDAVAEKARAVLDHYEAKMQDDSGKAARPPQTKSAPKLKGLWDCARLAALLEELGWITQWSEQEAALEQDNSKLPAMLGAVLAQAGAALIAMTQEEVGELLDNHDVEIEPPFLDDEVIVEMSLAQRFTKMLAKAGRVLSETNADHLDKAMSSLSKCATKSKGLADAHENVGNQIANAVAHVKDFLGSDDGASEGEGNVGAKKCMKSLRAAQSSLSDAGDLHDEMQGHVAKAKGHVKAVSDASKITADQAQTAAEAGSAADPDTELAFEAARRKRLIEVVQLADVP